MKTTPANVGRVFSPPSVFASNRGLKTRATSIVGFLMLLLPGVASRAAEPVRAVSFDQNIGAQLPLDVRLRDETGAGFTLGQSFGAKPAVLLFGYSRCPQLCSVVSNGAVESLRRLEETAGREFTVLFVSIDPADTPRDLAALKRRDVGRYGRSGTHGGWHYLAGEAAAVHRLTEAAGFHFVYDERRKLFDHPSGLVVITRDGRVAQYFLGIDYDPKDLAIALHQAGEGKTGHSVFGLLLVCARGLGTSGKYGRFIWLGLEISVALTVLVVFGGITWMFRLERAAARSAHNPAHWGQRAPPLHLVAFAFRDWLPERASTLAPKVDLLFWTLAAFTVVLVTGLVAANLYFLIRYRRGSLAPRRPLKISTARIETAWISATTVGFLGFFFWGARVYLDEERPPADALEINFTARQWMWDIRHENGRREFNELHVPLGEDVRLAMISEDVIHSFFVPAFRLKQDVVPGKQVTTWFRATKAGTFHLFCAEYCGTVHSGMVGDIVVMPPREYADWLSRGNSMENLAVRGRRLFTRYNCSGCHDQPAAVHAPVLDHVYGSLVPTSDGRLVRADELYLRDSILRPEKEIVAGYQPLMPSFQNVIPESDLLDLISYLKSLARSSSDPLRPEAKP